MFEGTAVSGEAFTSCHKSKGIYLQHCSCSTSAFVAAAEPWVTDTAACVLAHIALHKQLHPNLTDAIPAVVAALCKEIDTEEQLCDGDVTCEYVCQPAVEFLAHMASQTANLIDIGLANGIEALARAVAVEPGKQRVTERSILALNLIASGGPSFNNAVARWRNVTNFRNQIGTADLLFAVLVYTLLPCGND